MNIGKPIRVLEIVPETLPIPAPVWPLVVPMVERSEQRTAAAVPDEILVLVGV